MRPDARYCAGWHGWLLILCLLGTGASAAKLDRAKLEADGVIIGEIRIYTGDVFDVNRPDENRFVYRLANRLHVETREGTVERLLLFKVGDRYSDQLITESERLLRTRRAFFDASIRPLRMKHGKVVIKVQTRDIWSLRPTVEFGRSGGRNHGAFGVEELNLLGMGTQLSLGYASDKDRDSRYAAVRAPQIGRARWELDFLAADNSDGYDYRFGLIRPFFALDTRWSAGGDVLDRERREQRYQYGEIVDRYLEHQREFNVLAGWSAGLVGDWTQRFTFGLTYDDHQFSPVAPIDGIGTTYLPEDRKLVYPWIGYELVQNRFVVERNRDLMGRAEDVLLGWHAFGRLGFATGALGSDRSALVYTGALSYGDRPNAAQSWLVSSHVDGRLEDGAVVGALGGIDARYDYRYNDFTTTHVRIQGEFGHDLDLDQQVALGGSNGLRGYPYRYANGDHSAVLTLEQRFYSNWYPFRLFRVGGAVFADAGRAWGDTPEGNDHLGLLRDVGIGLRLANTRSGLGRVIHIDIAHPLDGNDDISSLQFLITTEQSF